MPSFIYRARDNAGRSVKGSMDASSKVEVVDKLNKMGYMSTRVTESLTGVNAASFLDVFKRVGTEDIILFNIQLSNMISAGISILASLDTLDRQLGNSKLRVAVEDIKRRVESGDSFSESLTNHPKVFSRLFVNMVKAGEASGKLDSVLAKYAQYFEHQADLKEKIKGALFYPAILLVAGIVVTLFIVTFVIPQFAEIFMQSGIELPMVTLVLYKVGMTIKGYWYVGLLGVAAILFFLNRYAKTPNGRKKADRLKLSLPIFGVLHRKSAISRFARTLGTLTASGVPILQSLDIVKEVIDNQVLAKIIEDVRSTVERGGRIADHLKASSEFPPDIVQMIAVGEESGNLDIMLNKISDFYDMSLGYTIKKLTAIIEPLFLIIMGSLIGFIMASMLLPIFDMIKVLGH